MMFDFQANTPTIHLTDHSSLGTCAEHLRSGTAADPGYLSQKETGTVCPFNQKVIMLELHKA